MLGPFATASRRTPHYHSPGVASHAARIAIAQAACSAVARATVATPGEWQCKIDVHNNNNNDDDNDNA